MSAGFIFNMLTLLYLYFLIFRPYEVPPRDAGFYDVSLFAIPLLSLSLSSFVFITLNFFIKGLLLSF